MDCIPRKENEVENDKSSLEYAQGLGLVGIFPVKTLGSKTVLRARWKLEVTVLLLSSVLCC